MNLIIIPGIGEIDRDLYSIAMELGDTILLVCDDTKPKLWVTRNEYMGIPDNRPQPDAEMVELSKILEKEFDGIELESLEDTEKVKEQKTKTDSELEQLLFTAPFDILLGTAIMIYGEAKVRARIRMLFEEDSDDGGKDEKV